MTDYNFAKNYENIKDWEFKNQSFKSVESANFVDQFLNLIKSYPNLILLIKTKKILFVPTLFVAMLSNELYCKSFLLLMGQPSTQNLALL